MDGQGTINPQALNSSVLSASASSAASQQSPRGIKRSRSPTEDVFSPERPDDDDKPRKRGRPPKSRVSESPQSTQPAPGPVQTPQLKAQSLPQASPTQSSPPKTTPTKGTVLKALPTVRDHTTDQLNTEGDEYIPREFDEAGEKKVTPSGHPLDGREYRCRTFFVPNRGDKLFMLATECARVLGYRDSYLLFNKNRSLYKIIATQAEKDDLIHQEILPYSYRSRQIAIVTARSMFRQFGSRLIVNGRRVRDDYWESKAIKQGFTEEDAAGEKRPGAAKQREAAAAEASSAHALTSLPHGEIIYSNGPGAMDVPPGVNPATLAPLPMINLAPVDELRARDYGNVQRPRHEISGPPYSERMQPSTAAEILNQAAHAAEFNKNLGQQRTIRSNYIDDYWKRPHEPVVAQPRQATVEGDVPNVQPGIQSPRPKSNPPLMGGPSHSLPSQPGPASMMTPQSYSQSSHATNPLVQTPMRPMPQPPQMHGRSPSLGMGGPSQATPYGYPQSQMWPPSQPQPSPLSQTHHSMQQFGHQQSPAPQQSPLHAPPQLHHSQSSGSMHGTPMGFSTMGGMNPAAYRNLTGNPYQHSPSPQHFMHQSTAAQQPGMQGWAPGAPAQTPQQNWQGF
ncbi:uncharacterized protein K452DRAFT_324634 [Aplosporella prunicola CBS 121167]|uniref:Uncharacterized protein n=1 Tax=Aplosporella prunicola CBS 121167 TaxID=1176127 RepID=A0A6A6BR26_9PEZI|nr:uncharacterized protein K452DRAFT_324634 [Aplosporella prunicola CBS 121167]KAF2145755.1 hypothetical protein K452DRAFT_324634 [Aplosporella prunicola CBS 121167]